MNEDVSALTYSDDVLKLSHVKISTNEMPNRKWSDQNYSSSMILSAVFNQSFFRYPKNIGEDELSLISLSIIQ